jgi:hypothetical protein
MGSITYRRIGEISCPVASDSARHDGVKISDKGSMLSHQLLANTEKAASLLVIRRFGHLSISIFIDKACIDIKRLTAK